ncbi:MAG TPA: hypothetical protein VMM37_10125 [Bacteroidota bacterium]|nr:hypothetical protein [Bacteroidota bacterium]
MKAILQFSCGISLLTCGLILLVVAASNAPAQSNRLLNYSIVSSSSSDHSPSFGKAIEQIGVQKLLLNLAESSRSTGYVDSALQNTPVSRSDLRDPVKPAPKTDRRRIIPS